MKTNRRYSQVFFLVLAITLLLVVAVEIGAAAVVLMATVGAELGTDVVMLNRFSFTASATAKLIAVWLITAFFAALAALAVRQYSRTR